MSGLLLALRCALAGSLGLLASGEVIPGEALATRFRSAHVGVEAWAATSPVARVVEGRVSIGYRRLGGTVGPEWLWYAPVDLTVGVAAPTGPVTLLAHAGPSLVVWGATPSPLEGVGSSGGNWGVRADIGTRVRTRLFVPPLHEEDPVIEGIDAVVLVGGRWSDVHDAARETCADCGFDFSAVRFLAGVGARF